MTRAEWARNLGSFLPADAGGKMFSYATGAVPQQDGIIFLEPWQGFLVLAAWFVVLFIFGAILLKRRDA